MIIIDHRLIDYLKWLPISIIDWLIAWLIGASIFFQSKVEEINSQLNQEYTLRRSMLLKRLDVTIQSFGWSDRAKVSLQ